MDTRGIRVVFSEPDISSFMRVMMPLLDEGSFWDISDQRVSLLDTNGGEAVLTEIRLPKCVRSEEMDAFLDLPLVVINGIFAQYRSVSDIYMYILNFADYMESECDSIVFVDKWRYYEVYIKDAEKLERVCNEYASLDLEYEMITSENDYRFSFRTSSR